ncbi:hypothetical protein ABZ806_33195 [Spirillospora sp. NPDC047418]
MTSQLPLDALARLVQEPLNRLGSLRRTPLPTVPVTEEGWLASVEELSFDSFLAELEDRIHALHSAQGRSHGGAVRHAAGALADLVTAMADDLWCLNVLRPAAPGSVEALRSTLVEQANVTLKAVANGESINASFPQDELGLAFQELVESTARDNKDPYEEAFGISSEELRNPEGPPTDVRILAAFHLHYDELDRIVDELLAFFPHRPSYLPDALHAASGIVGSAVPLIAVKAGMGVYQLIEEGMGIDPEHTARPLRNLKLRVDRSAASNAMMNAVIRMLREARSERDRASLTLDVYRKIIEGQLKPWAIVLLEMRGKTVSQNPGITTLREQLIADGHPLLTTAAKSLLPPSRNASAHEDYVWDESLQALRVGDGSVTLDELRAASAHAYSFMRGAESGWACARAASTELADLLDSEDPPTGFNILNEHNALSHFGTNGLRVLDYLHEDRTFTVSLDDLPPRLINHCCQAITWASRLVGTVDRFVVTLAGHAEPVMDIGRPELDATYDVWCYTRNRFDEMPPSVFLGVLTSARLAVETPAVAARAAAWLALNDIIHALDEAREASPGLPAGDSIPILVSRLSIVAGGIYAARTILTADTAAPLLRGERLVTAMIETVNSTDPPAMRADRLDALEDTVEQLRSRWPTPAILPTVDLSPLA